METVARFVGIKRPRAVFVNRQVVSFRWNGAIRSTQLVARNHKIYTYINLHPNKR